MAYVSVIQVVFRRRLDLASQIQYFRIDIMMQKKKKDNLAVSSKSPLFSCAVKEILDSLSYVAPAGYIASRLSAAGLNHFVAVLVCHRVDYSVYRRSHKVVFG